MCRSLSPVSPRPTSQFYNSSTQDTLFEPGSYRCQSKHHDLIAFTADVGLLLRVLKGAAANAADSVEVKLTIRQVADAVGAATSKPFLCFTATVRHCTTYRAAGGAGQGQGVGGRDWEECGGRRAGTGGNGVGTQVPLVHSIRRGGAALDCACERVR